MLKKCSSRITTNFGSGLSVGSNFFFRAAGFCSVSSFSFGACDGSIGENALENSVWSTSSSVSEFFTVKFSKNIIRIRAGVLDGGSLNLNPNVKR